MHGLHRCLCGLVLLVACFGCTQLPQAAPGRVRAAPLAADARKPLPDHVGTLELVGGYVLHAAAPDFGGISAARFVGDRLLLLSDRSHLFELDWPTHAPAAPFAMTILADRPLQDPRRRQLDAEALVVAPDGRILVGDEGRGRVLAYGSTGGGTPLEPPRPLPGWFAEHRPTNAGLETLAGLPDGSLLTIAEGTLADDDLHAAVRLTEGGATSFTYRAAPGYLPTDADVAGDRLFVLERRVSLLGGWQARIVTLPVAHLPAHPGATIDGTPLATISGPVLGENYEALAVRRDRGGFTLLVIADDNFNGIQETKLLELRWPG